MSDKQSRVISVRLHPSDEKEREALAIFDKLRDEGWSPRQIITDALLAADGRTPDMFKEAGSVNIRAIRVLIEDLLAQFLSELRRGGVQALEQEVGSQGDGESDEAYERRLANGLMARRKRGRGEL